MAQWPAGPVEPSGSPRTARRWFSNWLVTAPSMVQWPELWTRGAISLARSSPWCSKNSVGCFFRGALDGRFEARGGCERQPEDAAAVVVFDKRVNGSFAIARADREDGKFAGEGHKTLEDQFYGRQLRLCIGDVLRSAKNRLAFAVIAQARCFEDGGKAERFCGGVEFAGIRNGGKFGGGNAEFAEEILLGEAVLRGFESGGRRIDGNVLSKKLGGFHGDVFEFVGDQLEAVGKFFECELVGVIGGDALGDAAYGSFRRGIEKTEMQAEWRARESEHVAKLSTAEDADGHARFPFFLAGGGAADGSGLARTRPVCSARTLRKASRMAGYFVPRMAAARRAALTAPDLPMA